MSNNLHTEIIQQLDSNAEHLGRINTEVQALILTLALQKQHWLHKQQEEKKRHLGFLNAISGLINNPEEFNTEK